MNIFTFHHNKPAMDAYIALNRATLDYAKHSKNIATGKKNSSAPYSVEISRIGKAKSRILGLEQANKNLQDGYSMIDIADEGLEKLTQMLEEGKNLILKALNGALNPLELLKINENLINLGKDLSSFVNSVTFNGRKVLNGVDGAKITLQSGPNAGDIIETDALNKNLAEYGKLVTLIGQTGVLNNIISTVTNLDVIESLQESISSIRSELGVFQNRIKINISFNEKKLSVEESIRSRYEDADIAYESMQLNLAILRQDYASAMLAQANQSASCVFKLLFGQ